MNILAYLRLVTLLLSIIGLSMILPLGVALYYGESSVYLGFILPLISSIVLGGLFVFLGRKSRLEITPKTGFPLVASFWVFTCILGAIPLYMSGCYTSITDAFFESVSAFTTTGATVLSDLESLPRSINLWRTEMHWLGGMGVVALTVALFPLIGVGGFQLIKAETTGPEKGKITPKITVTAKILWFIYFGFTVIQTILLMFAGLDFVDALGHTFSALGTGGFSSKNASIAGFNSPTVEWICAIFMFLAGVNFSLYYHILLGRGKEIFSNSELKGYFWIVIVASLLVTFSISPLYEGFFEALRYGFFQVVSIISTTGYSTADFDQWPAFGKTVLFFLMFIGGCSGSTAGGIKVVRWVVLSKQMKNEVNKMLHPHGVFSIRLNNRVGRKDIVFTVSAFMFLYFILLMITTLISSLEGLDLISSFTASLSMLGNIGPGFGAVGPTCNFGFFSSGIKWWYSFVMLAGRLELYTMLIFFMPAFWKK